MSAPPLGDGLRLRDLLKFSTLNVEEVWDGVPLLLIVGDGVGPPQSDIFLVSQANASTSVIEPGYGQIRGEILPRALIVPIASKREDGLPIRVGRSEGSDVCINHVTVSHRHAILLPPTKQKPLWRICDIGSTNGTRVNGVRLNTEKPAHLRVMDDITFGELDCKFMDALALRDLLDWIRISGPTS